MNKFVLMTILSVFVFSGAYIYAQENYNNDMPRHYTYKIQEIPKDLNQQAVRDGIYDGLHSWSDVNDNLTFQEITIGTPNIEIEWKEYEKDKIIGLACIDCLDDEAFIQLVLEKFDCNGNKIQLGKKFIRNIIAHEFGHNLGLEHHFDTNNIMYSSNHFIKNYNTLGYTIPEKLDSFLVHEEYFKTTKNLLDKKLISLNEEFEIIDDDYKKLRMKYDIQYKEIMDKLTLQNENNTNLVDIDLDKINQEIEIKKQAKKNRTDIINKYNDVKEKYDIINKEHNCFTNMRQ